MTIRKIINTTYDAFEVWAKNGSNLMVKIFGVNKDGAVQLSTLSSDPTTPTGTAMNIYNKNGVIYIQDSTHGPRTPSFGGLSVVPSTSGPVATLPSSLYTNTGASSQVVFQLPTPSIALGDQIYFAVTQNNQYMKVLAQPGHTILNGNISSAAGGYFRNSSAGSILCLLSVAPTMWISINITGVWLVDE